MYELCTFSAHFMYVHEHAPTILHLYNEELNFTYDPSNVSLWYTSIGLNWRQEGKGQTPVSFTLLVASAKVSTQWWWLSEEEVMVLLCYLMCGFSMWIMDRGVRYLLKSHYTCIMYECAYQYVRQRDVKSIRVKAELIKLYRSNVQLREDWGLAFVREFQQE